MDARSISEKIVLYVSDVSVLRDEALFAAAYGAVSGERRQRTDRLLFARDKYLSVGGELLLRRALSELGADGSEMKIAADGNGKPYLPDMEGLFFNISHSADTVVCAVSDSEVGCDIEKLRDVELGTAKRFFTPGEYENVAAQPTRRERSELFFRYWTLKESFVKAVGLGLKLPLNSFEIGIEAAGISVTQHFDGRSYHFTCLGHIPGYCCAVCAVGGQKDVRIESVRLDEWLRGGEQ